MKTPAPTADEAERQATLDGLHQIYSPSEERFDRITALASKLFDVPYALISLVSRDIQWFKSSCGLDAAQTPRSISFCGHAIHQDDTFVVSDAAEHPDFADNPLVTGPPHIRFYAGQPIAHKGRHVGTLCIIDHKPRELSAGDRVSLRQLAAWVENELNTQLPGNQQNQFLETLDEEERAELIDPSSATWNAQGMQRLLEKQLNPQGPALFARLRPNRTLATGEDAGLFKRLGARLRTQGGGELILAHAGEGEWLIYQPDCDRPTADLLLQRLRKSLGDDALYSSAQPELWQAAGVQGVPVLPLDWDQLLQHCDIRAEAAVLLSDWAVLA